MAIPPFGVPPTPDATSSKKGKVKLANELGGTADSPTVASSHSGSSHHDQDHASRHKWLGADELALNKMLGVKSRLHVDFNSYSDFWSEYITGSGAVVYKSPLHIELRTNSTANSYCGLYLSDNVGAIAVVSTDRINHIWMRSDAITANTVCRWYVGNFSIPPTDGSDEYAGVRIEGSTSYFVHCDGTNAEVKTDISRDYTGAKADHWVMDSDGTDLFFYLNDTLTATHTTNLPGGFTNRPYIDITNGADTANKIFRIAQVDFTAP